MKKMIFCSYLHINMGAIFELLINKRLFEFFIENDLISSNQPGFQPVSFCVNQLLSITHEIYKSCDDGYKFRRVFPCISKAFDKAWHNELIHKLKQDRVTGS